ncbi:MAG: PEP-CTERM sorting domain-containing protein [Phycisphaera sp.]|nr:PEP-CTERM sorting domain-containing protein [Phycisphaera sp.]
MNRILLFGLGAAVVVAWSSSAWSAVIGFNVADQGMPYSEAGYDFAKTTNASNITQTQISSSELLIGASDGNVEVTMTRNGGGTFDIASLDYSVSGNDTGTFTEWRIISSLGAEAVLDSPTSPSGTLNLNWTGVTSVRFRVFESNSAGPNTMRIDNITIPEPASAALMVATLGGLLLGRRRSARFANQSFATEYSR